MRFVFALHDHVERGKSILERLATFTTAARKADLTGDAVDDGARAATHCIARR